MSPAVSMILVTYRSAAVAGRAVASFRRELADLQLNGEVVVVDHSGEPAETERLRELAPDRLLARPNRGYAAGINAGVEAAAGEVLLLANPDVELAAGSLAALLAALAGGWTVAGPQFELGGFLFPPADVQTPAEELRRWLAASFPAFRRRFLRREVARWRRVWEAAGPVAVPALSGALLAVAAQTARALGPWDEDYFLYFEESDWLRRAVRRDGRLAVVPGARVRHAWGHAARPGIHDPVFAASRRRYYGAGFGALGPWMAGLPPAAEPRPALPPLPPAPVLPTAERLWLVSPSPHGFPAARARLGAAELLPALARFAAERSHSGSLTVMAYDPETGDLEGPWRWDGEAAETGGAR